MTKNNTFKFNQVSDSSLSPDEDHHPSFGLGLMGGGSWGAFTAGVLEVIVPVLETIGKIKAISGTSAGAVNGVCLASGLHDKGAAEGVRRVNTLWDSIKQDDAVFKMTHVFDFWSPKEDQWPNCPRVLFNMMSGIQAINPMLGAGMTQSISHLLREVVPDWTSVQNGSVAFSANAVRRNILSGKEEHVIFSSPSSPDTVTASAALFGGHQIRDIKDPQRSLEELQYVYKDGGFAENPPMSPLLSPDVTDVIMIILHDHDQKKAPTPHRGAKLYHEEIHIDLASIALADSNRHRIHAIEIEMSEGEINGWHLGESSKLNTSREFIETLQAAGRKAAHAWLKENAHALGFESTYRPHLHAVPDIAYMAY